MPKTDADIEEERAIKEICYKSGKYKLSHSFLNSSAANIVNVVLFLVWFFPFPLGVCLGEYYRIQPPREHQSTNAESSPREKELLPSEATNRDVQKGKYFSSAWTMVTTLKITVTGRNYHRVCPSSPLLRFSVDKRQHITKSIKTLQ